jgi:hypothetical protein
VGEASSRTMIVEMGTMGWGKVYLIIAESVPQLTDARRMKALFLVNIIASSLLSYFGMLVTPLYVFHT